jgi:PAS domain S-box-containing protein
MTQISASTFHLHAMRRAGIGAWSWNRETRESFWSESMIDLLGLTAEDLDMSLSSYVSLVHPEDVSALQAELSRALEEGGSFSNLHRVIHPSTGDIIWVHGFGDTIEDKDGKVEGFMGVVRRREHTVGLCRTSSTVEYQTLLDSYPFGGIFEVDHEMRFVNARGSDSMSKHQLFPEEVIGRSIYELFDSEIVSVLEPKYRAALEGETVKWEMAFGDDHYRVSAVPVLNENNSVRSIMVVTSVMTEEKQLRDQLEAFQRQRQILSTAIDQVVVFHVSDDVKNVNWVGGAATRILSQESTMLLGSGLLNAIHEDDRQVFIDSLQQTHLSGKESPDFKLRVHGPSTCNWLTVRTFGIPDAHGEWTTASIFSPAHVLMEKENEIRDLAARLQALSNNPQIGIWELDIPNSDLSIAKPWPFEEVHDASFGHTSLERFERLLRPESISALYQGLDSMAEEGNDVFEVSLQLRPNGTDQKPWMQMTGTVLERDGTGKPVKVFGVLQDVGETITSMQNLKMFQAAVEQAEEGVIICSPSPLSFPGPRIIYVNNAQCKLSGYSRDELIGKTPRIFQGENTSPEVRASMREALAKGLPFEGELTNHAKDGREYRIHLSISPLRNEKGELVAFVSVQRDVTAEWKLKNKLVRSKEREQQLTEIKDTILSNMSHELKTPLAGIIGTSEILQETANDEMRVWLKDLNRLAHRLDYAFSSILELVDLKADSRNEKTERINIVPGLRAAAEAKFKKLEAGVKGTFTAQPSHIWGELNTNRLSTILGHVLDNAAKFTEEGTVEVSLNLDKDNLVVSIEDTGIGMENDFIPSATEPFEQESSGLSRDYEGLGIGLTIAQGMTRAMRGSMSIRSMKGAGTMIRVMVPLFSKHTSNPVHRIYHPMNNAPSGDGMSHSSMTVNV